jgi:hypothetical protein
MFQAASHESPYWLAAGWTMFYFLGIGMACRTATAFRQCSQRRSAAAFKSRRAIHQIASHLGG